MSLVTRCPVCGTAFRVQRAQLAARGGQVRCGKCGATFDGVGGLVEEGAEQLALEPSPQLGLFDPSRRPQPAPELEPGELPAFMEEKETPRRTWLWALFALLAATLLAGQAAYHFRAEVLALFPQSRATLEQACRLLECEVLPRRLQLMSIDGDELRADPSRDGLILLSATIRNVALFPQKHPALQLILEDEAGKPVVSRVLAPTDYLGLSAQTRQVLAQGIPPRSETSVRVYLQSQGVPATRYRLVLFYPTS